MSARLARSSLFSSLLVSIVLLLVVAPASGQTLEDVTRYGERLPAPGGQSMGMAGAGLFSGVDNLAALYGNPAGLGWLSGSVYGVGLAGQWARSNTQVSTPDATTSSNRTVSDYRLGSLGGAYSFPTERGSLVFGISLHQTNTYGRGFDATGSNRSNSITGTFLPSGYEVDGDDLVFDDSRSRLAYEAGAIDFSRDVYDDGGYPFFQGANPRAAAVDGQLELEQQENIVESGQMNELATGTAVEVAPGVMLGGGLNITFGSYTFERFYREADASDLLPPDDPDNPQQPYDPYFLEGTDLEGFHEFQLEERIDADITGLNLRAGLSAQVTSSVRGGIVIESPTWYSLTEVYGTEMRTDFDCDFSRSGTACPQGGVQGFESGSLTGNEFEYEIRTPWRFGTGLQYTQGGLTVSGDAELVDWTQAQVSADDASFTQLNRDIQGLGVTVNTQVGAEYEFDGASIRAGAAYRPDPRDQSFQDIDGQDTNADRLFLSAGASYTPDNHFGLHVSWLHERFDDAFSSYDEGPRIRERLARSQFFVGVTYRP